MEKGKKIVNKFKTGLVKGIQEEESKARSEQNKETIKKVIIKGTLSPFGYVIRKTATIILLILAAIGLLALIYPQTRTAMYEILCDQFNQIKELLNL